MYRKLILLSTIIYCSSLNAAKVDYQHEFQNLSAEQYSDRIKFSDNVNEKTKYNIELKRKLNGKKKINNSIEIGVGYIKPYQLPIELGASAFFDEKVMMKNVYISFFYKVSNVDFFIRYKYYDANLINLEEIDSLNGRLLSYSVKFNFFQNFSLGYLINDGRLNFKSAILNGSIKELVNEMKLAYKYNESYTPYLTYSTDDLFFIENDKSKNLGFGISFNF